jgi:ArsR family transcriptional regulator
VTSSAASFPSLPLAAADISDRGDHGAAHQAAVSAPDDFAGITEIPDFPARALETANFLKAFGHDGRLMILCYLATGPRSVGELENLLASRQAAVSQQLARLRMEGLVSARREAQTIYYSIRDPRVLEMLRLLKRLFCTPEPPGPARGV